MNNIVSDIKKVVSLLKSQVNSKGSFTKTRLITFPIFLGSISLFDVTNSSDLLNLMVTYWPLWMLPMLVGGLFGVMGLMMGFVMGIVIGTIDNLIPIQVTILMTLGILLILARREL